MREYDDTNSCLITLWDTVKNDDDIWKGLCKNLVYILDSHLSEHKILCVSEKNIGESARRNRSRWPTGKMKWRLVIICVTIYWKENGIKYKTVKHTTLRNFYGIIKINFMNHFISKDDNERKKITKHEREKRRRSNIYEWQKKEKTNLCDICKKTTDREDIRERKENDLELDYCNGCKKKLWA